MAKYSLPTRALSRQEAVFAGGSSGAALWGVRQVLADLGRADARVVEASGLVGSRTSGARSP